MKATVEDSCTACNLCVDICPDVFEMGNDNIAKVKTNPIPEQFQDKAREAASNCPVEAIKIEE